MLAKVKRASQCVINFRHVITRPNRVLHGGWFPMRLPGVFFFPGGGGVLGIPFFACVEPRPARHADPNCVVSMRLRLARSAAATSFALSILDLGQQISLMQFARCTTNNNQTPTHQNNNLKSPNANHSTPRLPEPSTKPIAGANSRKPPRRCAHRL